MDDEQSFGSWLRRCRKALGLTQAELAWQVGCVEGTYHACAGEYRLEFGRSLVSPG